MNQHEKINYIEFPSKNIPMTKGFFEKVFSWSFIDYGDDYTAFSDQGLSGGFYQASQVLTASNGAPLLVFYTNDLEKTLEKVEIFGGTIVKPAFTFPGGRRFHFSEPGGNELAVWSEFAE